MKNYCKKTNSPIFTLDVDKKFFRIKFDRSNDYLKLAKTDSVRKNTYKSVPSDIFYQISQKAIIAVALKDLLQLLKQTNRTRFKKEILNPLIQSKLIKMIIPDKPNSSKQKYLITEKCKKVLKSLKKPGN